MIFVHLGLVAVGALAGVVGGDLLGHRGIGRWPLAVATLVLMVVSGYLYNAELLAFTLGLGIAAAAMTVLTGVRELSTRRRVHREARAARSAALARQLEIDDQH